MSKESQPTVAATTSNQDAKYDTSFRLLDFNIFDEKRENEDTGDDADIDNDDPTRRRNDSDDNDNDNDNGGGKKIQKRSKIHNNSNVRSQ